MEETEPQQVEDPEPQSGTLNRALEWFSCVGHGRLWCSCGYLIWSCGKHKECPGDTLLIVTDHSRCNKQIKSK